MLKTVFVLPEKSKAELDRLKSLDMKHDWKALNMAELACTVQNFLILRNYGINVELDNEFSPDAINIGFVVHIRRNRIPNGCFVVGMRADYPKCRKCHFHVLINKRQHTQNSFWIPPWPQPGLVPRDEGRGTDVERIGYFGRRTNHNMRFLGWKSGFFKVESDVRKIAAKLGLEFVLPGLEGWNDYSTIDVAIAFRSWGNKVYSTKPPQKMVSAWAAGAPFVCGADSAYTQIAVPGEDFLRVTTPAEFEHALGRLMSEKDLYAGLVQRGGQKCVDYNSWLHAEWKKLLHVILPERYERWRQRSRFKLGVPEAENRAPVIVPRAN